MSRPTEPASPSRRNFRAGRIDDNASRPACKQIPRRHTHCARADSVASSTAGSQPRQTMVATSPSWSSRSAGDWRPMKCATGPRPDEQKSSRRTTGETLLFLRTRGGTFFTFSPPIVSSAGEHGHAVRAAWAVVGPRNAHVFARGHGAADVTDDPANRRRPRVAASWAIRGVAPFRRAYLPRVFRAIHETWPASRRNRCASEAASFFHAAVVS